MTSKSQLEPSLPFTNNGHEVLIDDSLRRVPLSEQGPSGLAGALKAAFITEPQALAAATELSSNNDSACEEGMGNIFPQAGGEEILETCRSCPDAIMFRSQATKSVEAPACPTDGMQQAKKKLSSDAYENTFWRTSSGVLHSYKTLLAAWGYPISYTSPPECEQAVKRLRHLTSPTGKRLSQLQSRNKHSFPERPGLFQAIKSRKTTAKSFGEGNREDNHSEGKGNQFCKSKGHACCGRIDPDGHEVAHKDSPVVLEVWRSCRKIRENDWLKLSALAKKGSPSTVNSRRRLPTLREFIEGRRHLKEVATEAAGGTSKQIAHCNVSSACVTGASASLVSQHENSEGSSSSSNPVNTAVAPLQASAKLEKLLAEADEAFWASRKLMHMAGWTIHRAPRSPSSRRARKSLVGALPWTSEGSAGRSGAAGRSTITPDVLRQQLQMLVAKNAAGRADITTAEESQAILRSRSGRLRSQGAQSAQPLTFVESTNLAVPRGFKAMGKALDRIREALRARNQARETAKRNLNALLQTRVLRRFFDAGTQLRLMQHIRKSHQYQKQLVINALRAAESCKQADFADFVEAWYSDLLATAADGLGERTEEPNGGGSESRPAHLERLLEIMRTDLQHGLQYKCLIDYVCGLKESDLKELMARVLIKSSLVFENPLEELQTLLLCLRDTFGRIPLPIQREIVRSLLVVPRPE
ncbi:hypothetical protein, conserved [Eimeria brunetti]|uniref:Uncharacterized protein n=1 Tax=Eimeria brunetti TaxID=51314 RepID=U6LCB5_9EIME|nr:hypothetical protein, conserved [Eimeria brunetti]